jgi:prophage regulatory protein
MSTNTDSNQPGKPDLNPPDKPVLIRMERVIEITGVSRATIYRGMKSDTFPHSIRTNMGSTAWVESEVYDRVTGQIDAFRAPGESFGGEHPDAPA